MKNTIEKTDIFDSGHTAGSGLRNQNQYEANRKKIIEAQSLQELEDITPPMLVGLMLLAEKAGSQIKELIDGKKIAASIFGVASQDGPQDFLKIIQDDIGVEVENLNAFDIDFEVLSQISEKKLEKVLVFHKDVRNTGLKPSSQHLVLRDHTGNCCPPEINAAIEPEINRVLVQGGISLVNITTSEALRSSSGWEVVEFPSLLQRVGKKVIQALTERIFSISQLEEKFEQDFQFLRGKLLEISPENNGFVVFNQGENDNGEWFQSLESHKQLWQENGFELIISVDDEKAGTDSHNPPLLCLRHRIVLRKL